ncbi:MAG: DNA integrity scanning protein DisA nucleotide-binding domain protein, partial [bacterium]
IIETGELLEARVSRAILLAIFEPHSPLHDGAVIIRGNRLMAAHCFLPLSDNPTLPSHYGTRHRAAVGLSEMSDAVILVVSEETGQLSLMHQGVVAERLAPVALKYQLQALLMPGANLASSLKDRESEEAANRVLPETGE